jgi:hypothetical protein
VAKVSFYSIITAAVADVDRNGFEPTRIQNWAERIRTAAEQSLVPAQRMEKMLRDGLSKVYHRLVDKGELARHHPGIELFTIAKLKPRLRLELDRRIMASADLIKLNRKASIEKTLQRFSGWATSVPVGGTTPAQRTKARKDIRKALAQLPFDERRVLIDQSAKFTAAISDIVAMDNGAIAAQWSSRWRTAGYDYREDHKEFDEKVFAIRDNWAMKQGLMKSGPNGFSDKIEQPAELPFCQCRWIYKFNLRDLPRDMLTAKGERMLKQVKVS